MEPADFPDDQRPDDQGPDDQGPADQRPDGQPPDERPPETALASVRGRLAELPEGDVHAPPMPVDRMVAEALSLHVSAQAVREVLLGKRLEPEQIDQLPVLAHALSEAQAELNPVRGLRRSEAERAVEAEAVELRAEMMVEARFVLRKDADAQGALDRVQEGNGLDDLVQDLRELAVVVERNEAAFEKAGTEPRVKAARARALATELASQLATRRGADRASAAAMDTRDRVASLLAETMAEVRAAATFTLRKNPRLLAKFRSANNVRKRGRQGESPEPEPVPAEVPLSND
ncbi:MAG TPA: hypothetical protein VFS43_10095 [Polyangiaceae bacterium]|nr:hypothetical protein [Polyangiaceae bacterium]